ncbi:MAG TPA: MotA/TolQ/ExbB proton channel family protein [Spirochaetota bacterium]|nr:MotA/TolQ/ExbB proton channel family protein [Spirochaetota bacterium]HPC40574.1 MotA/TolQ/ExbB proton channel family protein [Spirochaetota bacterium]HPL17560.1 MotA/TolQ/ExbB proton channel family protein [Spirochaetota bacterium]HQF07918.1 MotA/TolQ/ExbB proton channel family protein [Spirochaetota bacterium]HQH96478.1 MotA/TolQ/ExbB proton channel family protein [Spirochaetota bacterium]
MDILTNNIIVKGGWVMIPIILGSIVALGLTVERGMLLWKIRLDVKKFTDTIFSLLEKGHVDLAIEECAKTEHPIGRVLGVGLSHRGNEPAEIERHMEHIGNEEVALLEKNMHVFLVIVGVEPMLGFLGTIIGLIGAFMAWEAAGAAVTVEKLAGGIYQAMISTAGGLSVAIPYYIIYSIYINRINGIARDMNHYGEKLVHVLKDISSRKKK